ncbi:MAG: hypothetical protein EXR98_18410 [Gemmataceae bacterium]|nr:hypothetical protein [Gemmataceae bacterium]
MKIRKGAPLLFALAVLLGVAQAASASYCGAARFSILRKADCDAQCCYSTCQQQNRVCYKLVYDTVEQKRWHTCYQTVRETVNKQVTRTCYKEECKTMHRACHVTKYKDVQEQAVRNVSRTCWKDVQCTVCKPTIEHCVKDIEYIVRRCVPKACEKDCHYTVRVPKYEQHCHVRNCHVTKQICETHCREVRQKVCRPVTEMCHKDVCCQVAKCIEEICMKQVCVHRCKDVTETCYKTCVKRTREPVTTYKTVTRRVIECVDEPCDPGRGFGGMLGNGPFCGLLGNLGRGCNDGCATTGKACGKSDCDDPCFDPCACKSFHPLERLRARRSDCSDAGAGIARCAPCPTTRKVWKVRCITEQIPCTTYVTKCVTEKVAYTVRKKVHYSEVCKVSSTVRRNVRGAYVDDKGVGHENDGPGRKFKEGAVARKTVSYPVTRMVNTIEKKMVTNTVSRCARGAYVDDKGVGHENDDPGRKFKEGATYQVVNNYTTTKMVHEQRVKKVQYTVNVMVEEKQIKRVPYQVCRMVPHTVTKKIPYTVCEQEKYTVCKKVAYTECVMQPYTVKCKVPYTVTENVPCVVSKQVKVCVPETVCVKKARLVPVTVSSDPSRGPGNACHDKGWGRLFDRGGKDCCGSNVCLDGLRQRWFASLCSIGCCEQTCKTPRTPACKTTCNDCHDFCREGLLQRLMRNRFACETDCCTPGTPAPKAMPPAGTSKSIDTFPRALPKN